MHVGSSGKRPNCVIESRNPSLLIDFNCSVTIAPKGFASGPNLYSIHMFAVTYFPLATFIFDSIGCNVFYKQPPEHCIFATHKKSLYVPLYWKQSSPFISLVSNKSNGQLCSVHFPFKITPCNAIRWKLFSCRCHIWVHFWWDSQLFPCLFPSLARKKV